MMHDIDTDEHVVCQDHDPDIWHNDETEAEAIRLCKTGHNGGPCPQLEACLRKGTDPANYAWTSGGVWGGMSKHQRARIRSALNRGESDRYQAVTFPAPNCQTPMRESSL